MTSPAMSGERVDDHAFPVSTIDGYTQYGLTKREAFAMAALAVLGTNHPQAPTSSKEVAEYAFSVADAMLAQSRIQPDGQGA